MKYKFSISIIIISNLVLGQDYAWPTNTGTQLTSNFGEFRDDHFHMGIDIRTKQSTGHPLFAIADGFIYRISTNFKGYGKALYLKTLDGRIAVYGHLTKYTDEIEDKLYEFQDKNQSYFVNHFFGTTEYPVEKGDIIGYSGNTGGSMGPHLHFEIRNKIDQPLNPLTNGFLLKDVLNPIFAELAIIPVNENTIIDGSAIPKIYPAEQISNTEFSILDTISVSGPIAFAVRIIDKISGSPFSYQIEQVHLLADSISIFEVHYDSLDFSEDNYVSTVSGQPSFHPNNDDFQKLYRFESYPKVLIHGNSDTGVIKLQEGLHKIEIITLDAERNGSILSLIIDSEEFSGDNIQIDSTNIEINDNNKSKNTIFVPRLDVFEKGAIFQLKTDNYNSSTISVFIESSDSIKTFPLNIIDNIYSSALIAHGQFENSNNCGFLFESDTIAKLDFVFNPQLILPDSNTTVYSEDSLVSLYVKNSFYDTTLIWITDRSSRFHPYRMDRRSNVYEIFPKGIPFSKKIPIVFKLKDNMNIDKCAVYRFDEQKHKWKYINSISDSISVKALLSKPQIVAVFEDNKLPWVENSHPQFGQICPADSLKDFSIFINDDRSGFASSEDNLRVFLDDRRLWVAYQPFEQELSYSLRDTLLIGEHVLKINLQDRSGNSISKSIKFFVE